MGALRLRRLLMLLSLIRGTSVTVGGNTIETIGGTAHADPGIGEWKWKCSCANSGGYCWE
jgi:hypothetical protein